MRFFPLGILLFVFGSLTLHSQIRVFVYEEGTNEPIIGASVKSIEKPWGSTSDENGSVILRTINGSRYSIQYPGYQIDTINIDIVVTSLEVYLKGEVLSNVIILAESSKTPIEQLSNITIPIARVKAIPQLGGEADIMKSLALLPGISTGTEGSSGLYVRGGTPDQNLILMDDAPTYNLNHLLGFVAAVNPDAVSNVNMYLGPIPSRYGNRLSSIIDLSIKEGNKNKWHKDVSVGLISTHLNLNGPLSKKMTLNFNARANYLGLLLLPNYFIFKSSKDEASYQNFTMYDSNLKLTFDISKNDKVNIGLYSGHDFLKGLGKGDGGATKAGLDWGNNIVMARYSRLWGNIGSSKLIATYNLYNYKFNFADFTDSIATITNIKLTNESRVNDLNLKWANLIQLSNTAKIDFGTEWNNTSVIPSKFSIKSDEMISYGDTVYRIPSINLYGEVSLKFKRFEFVFGTRLTSFYTIFSNKWYNQPRGSIGFNVNKNSSILMSTTRTVQGLHSVANYSSLAENELWIPATDGLIPQQSYLTNLSYFNKNIFRGTSIRIGLFSKYLNNQVDYINNGDRFNIFNTISKGKFESQLENNGIGRAFGFEAQLDKAIGKFNGWISYTYSKNTRQFKSINNGNRFNHNFDRPHSISIVGSYRLTEKWHLNATWVYQSGRPVTLPTGLILDENNEFVFVFEGRNNNRMPDYHRLDLGFSNSKEKKKGKRTWNFGVYNAYFRQNPYIISVGTKTDFINKTKTTFVKQKSIFQFIPSVSYAFTWK